MTRDPVPGGEDAAAFRVRAARREYDAEAASYDARWGRYTRRTLALLRPLLPAAPGRLLDVGCGTASLAAALGAWGVGPACYVGADVSVAMLNAARAKTVAAPFACALAAASADALPFAAASFDTVVSASSLHRWPEAGRGLAEMRRVLRPGGRAVLLDWSADFLSMRAVAGWLRLRGTETRPLRESALLDALRDAGFAVRGSRRTRIGPVWAVVVAEAVAG